MVQISTAAAKDNIDMSNPALVDFGSGLIADPTLFAWFTPSFETVYLTGTNFTYSGSGDQRELSGGTITTISIDVDDDSGSETAGDLVFTDTGALIGSNIDKDDPASFWNEVLKGNDTFDLSGLRAEEVGPGLNIIFGDDLSAHAVVGATTTTDAGGNDTMTFAISNQFDLIGDAYTVAGFTDGVSIFRAVYDAGDDSLRGGGFGSDLIGDAWTVGGFATLNGGNDTLDNSRASGSSDVIGDAYEQTAGTVNGGDDTITLSEGPSPVGSGDVRNFSGGTLNGGNDIINGSSLLSFIGGDVLNIFSSTSSGTIRGGNDEITGGNSADSIGGDVWARGSTSNTIIGGDDVIYGSTGNDELFGEMVHGSLTNVSGGDDLIFGGSGNDTVAGQTGNDFLDGGSGDDTMIGGTDLDTASYFTARTGVRVSLATTAAQNTLGAGTDTISQVENLEGSRYNDFLIDGSGTNTLDGRTGNDVLRSALGDDTLIGGTGLDTADYSLATAQVVVNLATQTASGAGIGSDTLVQIENAAGGSVGDALTGSAGANTLRGNAGGDEITGGGGLDSLAGGLGTRDDFNYVAVTNSTGAGDLITDFEVGQDNIDVSALSAQLFTFSGQRATFNAAIAPELRYEKDTTNNLTQIYGDVNGDNVVDLHIRETGLLTHTSADFIL